MAVTRTVGMKHGSGGATIYTPGASAICLGNHKPARNCSQKESAPTPPNLTKISRQLAASTFGPIQIEGCPFPDPTAPRDNHDLWSRIRIKLNEGRASPA